MIHNASLGLALDRPPKTMTLDLEEIDHFPGRPNAGNTKSEYPSTEDETEVELGWCSNVTG
jgi:hypothetical protein